MCVEDLHGVGSLPRGKPWTWGAPPGGVDLGRSRREAGAGSEGAMLELVRRVAELKGELAVRTTSLKKRQVAAEPEEDSE